MALGKLVKGRNDKGARWHWANRQRVNWQKGEMVSGRKDDWKRWQWGKMVKGKMGRGQNGKGRNGKNSWAKWDLANRWEDTTLTIHLCNWLNSKNLVKPR